MLSNCSNNTNKLSPQEPIADMVQATSVQIIQINLALKNTVAPLLTVGVVQIIQINLALKNVISAILTFEGFK